MVSSGRVTEVGVLRQEARRRGHNCDQFQQKERNWTHGEGLAWHLLRNGETSETALPLGPLGNIPVLSPFGLV